MKTEFILPPSIWLLRNGTSYEYLLLRRSLTTMKWRAFVLLSPQSLRYRRAIWHNSFLWNGRHDHFHFLGSFVFHSSCFCWPLPFFCFHSCCDLWWFYPFLNGTYWEKHAWIARVPHSSRHKRRRLGRSWLAYLCGNKNKRWSFQLFWESRRRQVWKGK